MNPIRSTSTAVVALALAASFAGAQSTTLISLSNAGRATDGDCLYPEITPDGRFVAYQSSATTLVTGDTNGFEDVFVRDVLQGRTELASVDSGGAQGDGDSLEPAISADGRYVAFFSYATNLVALDTNDRPDIFVRDRVSGLTLCASVDLAGLPAGGRYPSISADGRFVAFESTSPNLVNGDTNGARDVFVRDLATSTTQRVSVDSAGQEGHGDSRDASISPDGGFVAFESLAPDLVSGDTNGVLDVFVRDLAAGTTQRASVGAGGVQGDGASQDPSLSALGAHVAFASEATNLVAGDGNGLGDIFVRDLAAGTCARVNVGWTGQEADWPGYDPTISADGRFVTFYSQAMNLDPSDRNYVADIFLCDRAGGTLERVSVSSTGRAGNGTCLYAGVSSDGRYVVFDSYSSNLVPGDVNAIRDVFVRDREPVFELFCFGDGSLANACPCANTGDAGRGCANSSGSGGVHLEVAGTLVPDTLHLHAWGSGPSALSIFLQGDASAASGVPFGDGLRCVDGNLKRLYTKNASGGAVGAPASGDVTISARSAALGDPLTPGSTRVYQVYYRDPSTSFCPGFTFNVSSGAVVHW